MPHFDHCFKKEREGETMKVLVHLNHGLDKSYLLGFEHLGAKEVRAILENSNEDLAIQKLMACSTKQDEIAPNKKQQAQNLADFTLSQHGYTIERLA